MQIKRDEHPASSFLKSLYSSCNGGFIHILLIDRARNRINKFITIEKLDSITPLLKAYRGYNVYFGVATRVDGDSSKDGIIEIPCLYVDIDLTDKFGVDIPEDKKKEILQRLKDFQLKPSFIINSGGGVHIYWKLKEPFLKSEISLAENLLDKIASYFNGDLASTDASHNLRLPGMWNFKPKYKTPRKVTIEEANPENEYSPDDFEAILPQAEESYHSEERQYHQETNERLSQIMQCEFLKHCDKDRATLPEPEWLAMISILERQTGGISLIHSLSQGYPRYSSKETDAKIRHANEAGPATCERIKTLWDCGKDCGVKSPASLAIKGRATGDERWPDPLPFDEYSSLPDFPTDALSGVDREMVQAVSEVNQVDPALTACLYLAALSSSCSKKAKVDLISHKEPLNLYLCPILDSGNRRSSTDSSMTRPLYEFQKAHQEDMKKFIQEAQNIFKIKEKRLERLQKRAAEEEDLLQITELESQARKLALELSENPVPKSPVYLVDDITPEKLGALMADNGERTAVITTEGGLFDIMAGRYSKDGIGNIDLCLKAHAGDPWSSQRIGREAKTMEAPALTLCLAVQSEVTEEAGKNKRFRGKGLLARFLYARCKSQVGYRQRQTISILSSLTEHYKNHVFSLMDIPFTETILRLSPEAQRTWDEFYDDIEKEMRPGESLQYLTDWGSKLPGAVARISGLLHLAEHGAKGLSLPISVNSVSASCMIGAYFKEHAIAVFGLMQEDRRFKLARQILAYFDRVKPETFKGRDIMHHTSINLMEEVELGVKVLLDRGFVREEVAEGSNKANNPGPGRPSGKTYRVNPKIFERRNV